MVVGFKTQVLSDTRTPLAFFCLLASLQDSFLIRDDPSFFHFFFSLCALLLNFKGKGNSRMLFLLCFLLGFSISSQTDLSGFLPGQQSKSVFTCFLEVQWGEGSKSRGCFSKQKNSCQRFLHSNCLSSSSNYSYTHWL